MERGHFRNYALGAPLSRAEKNSVEEAILARFGGNAAEASAYIDRIIDRQITKAGGILNGTAILAGISVYVKALLPLGLALVTILLMLTLYYVQWSRPDHFRTAQKDFESMIELCYTRSVTITIGSLLTFLSVVLLILHIIFGITIGA